MNRFSVWLQFLEIHLRGELQFTLKIVVAVWLQFCRNWSGF